MYQVNWIEILEDISELDVTDAIVVRLYKTYAVINAPHAYGEQDGVLVAVYSPEHSGIPFFDFEVFEGEDDPDMI